MPYLGFLDKCHNSTFSALIFNLLGTESNLTFYLKKNSVMITSRHKVRRTCNQSIGI